MSRAVPWARPMEFSVVEDQLFTLSAAFPNATSTLLTASCISLEN